MKKPLVICLSLMISAAALMADPPVDTRVLPLKVRGTVDAATRGGKVQKITTRQVDGQLVYEVEFKERGDERIIWVKQDGTVLREESVSAGLGARGKGKGKAKGLMKGRGDDREEEAAVARAQEGSPRPVAPATETQVRPAQAPSSTGQTPGARPQPEMPAPVPAANTVLTREMKADFNRRIDRMSRLDNHREAVAAGLAVIEKETGVARATLQTQMKSSGAGLSTLLIANEIAREKGRPVAGLLNERRSGRTWEVIAANHQYDLGLVLPKLQRVEAAMSGAVRK